MAELELTIRRKGKKTTYLLPMSDEDAEHFQTAIRAGLPAALEFVNAGTKEAARRAVGCDG